MNTFQLSCFLAVAEYLNFAQAAQSLHVTPPAVSQQIKALEGELTVKLFYRTTRTVRLTEKGKAFLHDAQQIVALVEGAKRRLSDVGEGSIETLAIGCYNFPCMFLLSDVLEVLRSVRPEVHPRLQIIPFKHIFQMLEEGDLDAVVGFRESSKLKIKAQYKEITESPLVCLCSCKHPLAGRSEVGLEDLEKERLALLVPSRAIRSTMQIQGRLMGERPPSEFYFCESAEAITVLVSAGYGISVLPDLLVPDSPLIAKIPLENSEPLSFGVYYRTIQGNATLKAFIQCAEECLS